LKHKPNHGKEIDLKKRVTRIIRLVTYRTTNTCNNGRYYRVIWLD